MKEFKNDLFKPKSSLFLIFAVFLFFSCKTTFLPDRYTDPEILETSLLYPQEINWQELEIDGLKDSNFQYTGFQIKSQKIEWKCIRIDLNAENLQITAEPQNSDSGKSFYLKDFSKKKKSLAAINTVPFAKTKRGLSPVSIVKIDGRTICPLNENYSALAFSTNPLRASIIEFQNQNDIEQYPYVFGGFFTILKDGYIYEFQKNKRSRSAAGISRDGRYLYLFACKGINCPTGRNGLNFEECALILKKLGANSAMQFDGGHSTGLTLKDKDFLHPDLQRKVPAALGFLYKNNYSN